MESTTTADAVGGASSLESFAHRPCAAISVFWRSLVSSAKVLLVMYSWQRTIVTESVAAIMINSTDNDKYLVSCVRRGHLDGRLTHSAPVHKEIVSGAPPRAVDSSYSSSDFGFGPSNWRGGGGRPA